MNMLREMPVPIAMTSQKGVRVSLMGSGFKFIPANGALVFSSIIYMREQISMRIAWYMLDALILPSGA